MDKSVKIKKIERAPSGHAWHETIRIILVVLGVGTLTLWTYWQTLFFGQNWFQYTHTPLWLASFFPALGLGLALYTFAHHTPRYFSLSGGRHRPHRLTESQTYMMLCTAICLFAVNYRILPIAPLANGGGDPVMDSLIMTVVKQQASVGALGMAVVFLQGWLVIQEKGGSRRNLTILAASLLAVGLLVPWPGWLDVMPIPAP